MRRSAAVLLMLALTLTHVPSSSPQIVTGTFTEHFETSAYEDPAHTTAHWDTSAGYLKLPPTEPVAAYVVGVDWAPSPAVYAPDRRRVYHLSTSIVEYDPQENVAIPMEYSGPRLNTRAAAVYAGEAQRAYLFGGCVPGPWQSCVPRRDIFEFNPETTSSTLLGVQLPYGLNGNTAAYVPGTNSIFLFGGTSADHVVADIFEFDVATKALRLLSARLPSARRDAIAVFAPSTNRVYVFGGRGTSATLAEILVFDPGTRTISTLATALPVGLQQAAAAYVSGWDKVLVFGGQKPNSGASKAVYAFTATTGAIAPISYELPGGIIGATAVYASESDWLVLLGGEQYGVWPSQHAGILRLRRSGDSLSQRYSVLPRESHTYSAVYDPSAKSAFLFGGGEASILRFDIQGGLVYTMGATLPFTSTDPGVVWVPSEQRAYVFTRSQAFSYAPTSDLLITLPVTLPTGFDARAAVYVTPPRNAIYLFDSANGNGSILRYDLDTGTRVTLSAHLERPRRSAACYVPGVNRVFLLGGWGYQSKKYLADILVFDVTSETLSPQQGLLLPIPGEYEGSAHLPTTNRINLLGGWGGWSEEYAFPFENVWQFDTTTEARRMITTTLTAGLGRQAAVWDSVDDRLYTFGGQGKSGPVVSTNAYDTDRMVRFDVGHSASAVAQSTRINSGSENVSRATLDSVHKVNGGTLSYFLSNNGGATWETVTPGQEHVFSSSGNDLRWKAQLTGDGVQTPVVDELTIKWAADGVAATETPTATPTTRPSPTATCTLTAEPTPSPSATVTATPSPTAELTRTRTATATRTPTRAVTVPPTRRLYLPVILHV